MRTAIFTYSIKIFCKLCPASFKIGAIHLKTQYSSHLTSNKHKEASNRNIVQPSIFQVLANASALKSKDDSYNYGDNVERSFSMYKHVLFDRLHSLTESNIAKLNVIQFNNFVDDEIQNVN